MKYIECKQTADQDLLELCDEFKHLTILYK